MQQEERFDIESFGLRAAQYVRASTDMQRYSNENQKDTIAAYAARRDITIVRTYSDDGVSGVALTANRPPSVEKTLIRDAISGSADFDIILVYDVSRWGRFPRC